MDFLLTCLWWWLLALPPCLLAARALYRHAQHRRFAPVGLLRAAPDPEPCDDWTPPPWLGRYADWLLWERESSR